MPTTLHRVCFIQKQSLPRRLIAPPLSAGATSARGSRQRLAGLHISERRIVLMLGDMIMISLALLAALWLRIPGISELYAIPTRLFVLKLHWWLVLWAVWIPVSITADCYDLKRSSSVRGAIHTATCALAACALYFVVPSISAPLTSSRLAWFIFALFAVTGAGAWRVVYALLLSQSTFSRLVLIVGAGCSGAALAKAVDTMAAATGVELVGFVDDNPALQDQEIAGKKVLGTSRELVSLAKRSEVSEVIVAITDPHRIGADLLAALVDCWKQGISVIPMSLYFEELTARSCGAYRAEPLCAGGPPEPGFAPRMERCRRVIDIVVGLEWGCCCSHLDTSNRVGRI